MQRIDVNVIKCIEEIKLSDGIRELYYYSDGYSYWYKGKEVSNKDYSYATWLKIRQKYEKYINGGSYTSSHSNPMWWNIEDRFRKMMK